MNRREKVIYTHTACMTHNYVYKLWFYIQCIISITIVSELKINLPLMRHKLYIRTQDMCTAKPKNSANKIGALLLSSLIITDFKWRITSTALFFIYGFPRRVSLLGN